MREVVSNTVKNTRDNESVEGICPTDSSFQELVKKLLWKRVFDNSLLKKEVLFAFLYVSWMLPDLKGISLRLMKKMYCFLIHMSGMVHLDEKLRKHQPLFKENNLHSWSRNKECWFLKRGRESYISGRRRESKGDSDLPSALACCAWWISTRDNPSSDARHNLEDSGFSFSRKGISFLMRWQRDGW